MSDLILVIEDEPGIADFVRRGLEAAGFTVETETDGQLGLLAAQRDDIQLVILDLGLPGLLEPDQVSALLHERQAKQSAVPGRKQRTTEAPLSAHRALAAQRKELNKLVAAYAKKTGAPHANVHMELRRACGGPELAAATSEHVAARIDKVRLWFVGRR